MFFWSRYALACAITALLLVVAALPTCSTALAQGTDGAPASVAIRADHQAEDLTRLLDLAHERGQNVVVHIEVSGGAGLPRPPGAPTATDGFGWWRALADDFVRGLNEGIEGVRALPRFVDNLTVVWRGLRNASSTAGGLARIAGTVAVGLLLGLLARRALDAALRRASSAASFLARLGDASRRGFADLVGLAVFALAVAGLRDRLLGESDLARFTATDLAYGIVSFWLYWMVARFLLSPDRPEFRLLPIRRPDWYYRWVLLFAAMGALFYVSVNLLAEVSDAKTVEGWYLVTSTLMLVLKLWWFWSARADIAVLMRDTSGDRPARLRTRVAGPLVTWALIAVAILNWLVARCAAALPDFGWWSIAVAVTQVAVVLLPIVAGGADALIAESLGARDPAASPLRKAAIAVGRTLARAGVWVLGLVGLAQLWGGYLATLGSGAQTGLREFVTIAAASVTGWTVWSFASAYLSEHAPKARAALPGDEEDADPARETRLATALPLVRGTILVAVAGVTALIVLSTLGVNIGPLLAGFGVLGLALSFGSQALVRDIVSGIFFMIDDAFRVGEYIDTGRLKGTAEKITIRSVQLRHQSGLVHTIPFGQLQSVTNASRDWATVKFNILLEHGTDLERTRKIIKRVGETMVADPELGPEIIQPLKLQGVAEITQVAIVCRIKVTARPARASWVQREGLKRVYAALEEGGVAFASGVMVKSLDGDRPRTGIAAGAGLAAVAPAEQNVPSNVAG